VQHVHCYSLLLLLLLFWLLLFLLLLLLLVLLLLLLLLSLLLLFWLQLRPRKLFPFIKPCLDCLNNGTKPASWGRERCKRVTQLVQQRFGGYVAGRKYATLRYSMQS
jgi:hypothetical protein